jgi:hypothetical protein
VTVQELRDRIGLLTLEYHEETANGLQADELEPLAREIEDARNALSRALQTPQEARQ